MLPGRPGRPLVFLSLQLGQVPLGLLQVAPQRRLAVVAVLAGAGRHLAAVGRHLAQFDQPVQAQGGHVLELRLPQGGAVLAVEVGQQVVADRVAAAQPLERPVAFAQLGQVAGALDPLEGGVQPQGEQQGRGDDRGAGAAFDRLVGPVKPGQLELADEVPDDAGRVGVG